MPAVLTEASDVRCVHMAPGRVSSPVNRKAKAEGGRVLVESDVHTVSGCPFMKGNTPSPCVTIQWASPAVKVAAGGPAVLTNASIGKCIAADQSMQGLAVIVNQKKAKAT